MTSKYEIRAGRGYEFRDDAEGVSVSGHAAVFGEEAVIGDMFRERIAPGAFGPAISRGDDVVFLINHEGLPLARTRSGTLKLSEDARGLLASTTLDAQDPDVMSIVPKMRRRDLDKMSFAFLVTRDEWDDTGSDMPLRTIHEVELFDVSIVTTPAYVGTDIGLRSLSGARTSAALQQHTLLRTKANMAIRLIR